MRQCFKMSLAGRMPTVQADHQHGHQHGKAECQQQAEDEGQVL